VSTESDDTIEEFSISEAEAASTGAAADAAESDERLAALPRILRMVMVRKQEPDYLRERLIGEIAESCPGLSETTAWAKKQNRTAGLKLARKLDRLAVSTDRSDLRSIADCIRLISLPLPHNARLIADHKRVAKSLLIAQRALPNTTDPEIAVEIERIVWGWAALPVTIGQLSIFSQNSALHQAAEVGRSMARERIEQAKAKIRDDYAEQARANSRADGASPATVATGSDQSVEGGVVVCRMDEASMKNPKMKEIVGPFKDVINVALPLIAAPPLHEVRQQLLFEFPYASTVIDFCLTDLVGRTTVHLRPLLLWGPPGGRKSRFARRLGEVLGVHVWRTDGSRSDGAVFGGTDKRWYSAEPCHSFLAIAQAKHANPLVMIDEIEKAATRSDYGRLWDSLLGFLEPETAARYPDPALQVNLDLSAVSYIATANSVDPLPTPIRDRFRVVEFPKPSAADLDALLPAVIADIAAERGLDARWIEALSQYDIDIARRLWRGGSVRRLRRVFEAIVNAREGGASKH